MTKRLWCWRCKAEVPMFDDAEHDALRAMYLEILRTFKEPKNLPKMGGPPISKEVMHERMAPVREAYFAMTGEWAEDVFVFWHHRFSAFGPPCRSCGKPLRTSRAKYCAGCGTDL